MAAHTAPGARVLRCACCLRCAMLQRTSRFHTQLGCMPQMLYERTAASQEAVLQTLTEEMSK